ncbi:hypothetical protein GCM10009602_14010 [Nocardiopsis tropica]
MLSVQGLGRGRSRRAAGITVTAQDAPAPATVTERVRLITPIRAGVCPLPGASAAPGAATAAPEPDENVPPDHPELTTSGPSPC